MIDRVKHYIIENKMVQTGDRVIIGVSGGPDSMVLLYIMKELQDALHISIAAAHLNHSIRDEAAAEEQYVRQTCCAWGIPCYVRQENIPAMANRCKKSLEEAGRDARYNFSAS